MPDDQLLRAHGWQVHSRPRRGPVLWRRGKVVLTQAQALALIHLRDDPDPPPSGPAAQARAA